MAGGKKARDKGRRGEQDVVNILRRKYPDVKRVGYSFIKSLIDVQWEDNVAQVKNRNISGNMIATILDELKKTTEGKKCWVIFKPRRGQWLICQSLNQYVK